MNGKIHFENTELKITPKNEHYFRSKLFNERTKSNRRPIKILSYNNNIKSFKDKNLTEIKKPNYKRFRLDNKSTFEFDNKFLRDAINMSSSQSKQKNKKDFGCYVNNIRRNIILGKDLVIHKKNIDLNIPHNLYTTKLLKSKTNFFNSIYEKHIQNNIKKFLMTEMENKTFTIKKNKTRNKNIILEYLDTPSFDKNLKKIINIKNSHIKKRPKSTMIKYMNKSKYKELYPNEISEYLYSNRKENSITDKNSEYKKSTNNTSLRSNNKYKLNVINFNGQLKKISKIFNKVNNVDKANKTNNNHFIRRFFLRDAYELLKIREKKLKNQKKKNISFNYDNTKINKQQLLFININYEVLNIQKNLL